MRIIGLALIVIATLSSCSTYQSPYHSYERNFYVAEKSIDHLAIEQWEEIKVEFEKEENYKFSYAIRLNQNTIRVDLKKIDTEHVGISLFFHLIESKWIIDKNETEEIFEVS